MAFCRILFLLVAIASLSHAAELTTHDGKKVTGDIIAIDGKELIFQNGNAKETFELTKLNVIEIIAAPKDPGINKAIEVEFVDGSQLRCVDFKLKDKTALLTLAGTKQIIEAPASSLLYMIRDVSEPKLNQAFRGLLSKRGKRDTWIVLKGDSLDGVNGTFGDGDAKGENISFELEATAEKLNIQMARVYGMILSQPPGVQVAQTVCKVIDAGKNVLYAKSLEMNDKKFIVETVTGVRLEYPSISSVAKLDFSAGSMMYLSNAEPIKVEQTSTEGIPEVYRRDRNLDNNELKLNNVKYPKGLALHSRTVLTYDLGGKYKLFQALVGVDDCVEGESQATLIIETDFKPVFKEVVKKGAKPKLLNLAVLNVKQLRITVESDFLDLGNQIDLANAKVLK